MRMLTLVVSTLSASLLNNISAMQCIVNTVYKDIKIL